MIEYQNELETAPQTTTLFRAVDSAEMADLQSTGTWNPSLNGAVGKGFFYSLRDAERFGVQQTATFSVSEFLLASRHPARVRIRQTA
jgi:hypothetical protein